MTVDFIAGTAVGAAGSDVGTDTLINFNEVRGSSFADTLLGSNRTDVTELYEGRGGNDSIDGRGGFDIVRFDAATGARHCQPRQWHRVGCGRGQRYLHQHRRSFSAPPTTTS